MKKPKLNINFGEGGFQGWLIRHCEKMILGVVIFLALWVIWGGWGLPGLDGDKSPEKLRADAQKKQDDIRKTSWEVFKSSDPNRAVPPSVRNGESRPISALDYPRRGSWNPSDFPKLTPRTDPVIFPPINLKPVPLVGPVAYQPIAGIKDGLADAEEVKGAAGKVQPRAPAAAPPRTKRGASGPISPMGPMGAGDGADLLSGFADAPIAGGAMPGESPLDGGGMPGMGGGGVASVQQSSSSYQAPPSSIAQTRYAVVLMAIVQHERQWEEFDRVLKESLDHDVFRDQPNYLTFFVQRVDVTDDPSIDPAAIPADAWKAVSIKAALEDAAKWAGYPRDVLDPNSLAYVDPHADASQPQRFGLTHPLPPFVQRDLWDAMTHPDIPLASAARQRPTQVMPEEEEVPGEEGGEEVPGVPGSGGRRRPGVAGGGMMPGGGMMGGGIMGGGMMPPGGAMSGGPGGMMDGPGGGETMAGGMMGGGMMGGMMGGGMPGGGMMGGMMGGMGSLANSGPGVKYKLIRMTDFGVEPGRKYRYRVKSVLDDPNNSQMFSPPRHASLDETVRTRLNGENVKTYRASDEWSAPSEVVSLPASHWFYAGKVESDSGQVLVTGTRPVRREPTAKMVAIVHDSAKGADVPSEQEVFRGTTLNLKADVDVVHPIRGIIHTLKDYALRTDAVVADMFGGEVISPISKEGEKMTIPGEILLVDSDGNLIVQDEADDVEDFQRYVPPESDTKPVPAAAGDAAGPMGPMGGLGPGEGAGPGEAAPPMGGGKRGKRGGM